MVSWYGVPKNFILFQSAFYFLQHDIADRANCLAFLNRALTLKFQSKRIDPLHRDHGLVFRSFIYLFDELSKRSEDATYVIKASYLEIYNEKVCESFVGVQWRTYLCILRIVLLHR